MKITQIAKILKGQDGVVWKKELFRFDHLGNCSVYDLNQIEEGKVVELSPITQFALDKYDLIVPHSNATFWGKDYFCDTDEFPLLYTNMYNSPSKFGESLLGACCVYRLQRRGKSFETTLVQIIQIDFTNDSNLWKTYADKHGVRPYGNFVIDIEKGFYHAFVMRNDELGTRHFKFNIPSLSDGEMDENYGVKKVYLKAEDILETFSCPYQRYIQGATIFNGKLYSTEGFSNENDRPAIAIIDLNKKQQESYVDLWANGYLIEPELIDFEGGVCYYSDANGNLYNIEF